MNEEIKNPEKAKPDRFLPFSIIFSAVVIAGTWVYATGLKSDVKESALVADFPSPRSFVSLEEDILPRAGVEIPVQWGNLGKRLVEAGVIDSEAFETLYASRGGLTPEEKNLLYGDDNGKLRITEENAGYILNLLWALGLSNKNEILEAGPMSNPQYGGAGVFASTGGWTLAKGDPMNHYSGHSLVKLTGAQQQLVERVSKNIYRPCCNNPTHFPDCNHGMAMLGLLELMAAQGLGEEAMYRVALQVNAYWFPETYLTIDKYLGLQGTSLSKANPKEILGASFSSASGYQNILSKVTPPEEKPSGSCGV